jgi:hypothetical protein
MNRQNHLPWSLAALFCLAVYSDAYPYGVPLFFPLAVFLFIWFGLVHKRLRIPFDLGSVLLIGTVIFYCAGMLKTGTAYNENKRDLQNAAGLIVLIPVLCSQSAREFRSFRNNVQAMNSFVCALIALFGLYKFELLTAGVMLGPLWVEGRPYPWGTSLVMDYNFFAFAMLVGAISSLFSFWRSSTIRGRVYYQITFLLAAISMAFSGSRRGWVTEGILFAALGCFLLWRTTLFLLNVQRSIRAFNVQHLRAAAAILIVLCVTVAMISKYGHLAGERNRGIEGQVESMQERFLTLADPAEAFNERSERWQYSLGIMEQSSLEELSFGHGFDYLPRFASRFQTRTEEDYPHNPVISAALYSGLIGAVWVASFLLISGIAYYVHRKEDIYFAILYFSALWFVMPSFNSLLSGKFLIWLLVTPWLVRSAGAPAKGL